MTLQDIARAYKRDGKLVRSVAKDVAKQTRAGTLTSADFVGIIPFPVLEDAYLRFGHRYPLKRSAWGANVLAALDKSKFGENLAPKGDGNGVPVPGVQVKLD